MALTYDEIRAIIEENERLKAVLADQIEEKHGTSRRWVVNVVEHADKLAVLIERLGPKYRDECPCCLTEGMLHEAECELVEFWRVTEHPNYQPAIDATFKNWCRVQEEVEREERRCTARGVTRCRLEEGHEGAHEFPTSIAMTGISAGLKELYPPARVENLVMGDAAPLFVNRRDFESLQGLAGWRPEADAATRFGVLPRAEPIPSEMRVIASPLVPEGTAYLMNPSKFTEGSPADAIQRAREALERMSKGKP